MDCYSRKNIYDAVMEAGAFAHLRGKPPSAEEKGERAARGGEGAGRGVYRLSGWGAGGQGG
jgi:hypothetical protein